MAKQTRADCLAVSERDGCNMSVSTGFHVYTPRRGGLRNGFTLNWIAPGRGRFCLIVRHHHTSTQLIPR